MAGSEIPLRPLYDPQSLLNAQPVMVAVIDPASYTIQFQNKTGLQKLGDLSGRTCYEAIAHCPAPCSFCKMPQAMSTGEVTVNEVPLPNDQFLLVQWTKAPTEDGRTHIIETITDITAQKRMEEAARRTEKMEALGKLAGGMAHDINNLLTVIVGASELIPHRMDDPESSTVPLLRIRGAIERAAEITRRLVAFSHHEVVRPSLLELNGVVGEFEPRIRTLLGDEISLELQVQAGPASVLADKRQIEHIIAVLVSNAREAMPDGGSVTISTWVGTVDERMAEKQAVKPGRYVRLAIRDSGRGIPPEVQAHLFEPFFSRTGEQAGRGLGLASVYGMIRQSGGFIEVTSESNMGTEFLVHFPESEAPQYSPAEPAIAIHSGEQPTILLVEDDGDVRMAVGDTLKRAGYSVQEACDGIDAFQRLQSMKVPPLLVLTDVMMPRMTGPQLAKQIHSIMPSVQVLYMSGYPDEIPESVGNKRVAFISKPFNAGELLRAIRETLVR